MGSMNDLNTVGINPFAVQLVAESLLKSPMAAISTGKPITIAFPVQRGDISDYKGLFITLQAVRKDCQDPTAKIFDRLPPDPLLVGRTILQLTALIQDTVVMAGVDRAILGPMVAELHRRINLT